MGGALSGGDSTVSSVIAVRLPSAGIAQGPPPFTGLVQMILDAHTGSAHALTAEALFRAMQSEEVMFADIPAAGCFLGQRDFVLVPAAAPPSIAPAARAYEETDDVTVPRLVLPAASAPLYPPPPPPRPRPSLPPAQSAPPPAPPSPASAPPSAASAPTSEPQLVVAPASLGAQHCRRVLAERERSGDRDGAYRAAMCLDALREADINESLLANAHRPDGLQAVRGALSYADWHERLCSGWDDPQTSALLRALGPALGRVGFQHARRMRRELPLPADARQDPETSTTTLAKTLYWTSRLLSVQIAELYVLPEFSEILGLVPGSEHPVVACERSLGSGFSLPELACLWARELSFARAEQAALCYFPDAAQLAQLLLAALAVGGAIRMRAIDGDAKRLSSLLKREVRGAALGDLRAAAQAFPVVEVDVRARAFIRAAEHVASRVALVACGDLELTLELERRFPRRGLSQLEERRADLLNFTISSEFGQIRAALGIAVP